MRYEYSALKIFARDGAALKAAEILRGEIESRMGKSPEITGSDRADISFIADPDGLRDGYEIEQDGKRLVFKAQGIRGLILPQVCFCAKSKSRAKNHAHTGYRRQI